MASSVYWAPVGDRTLFINDIASMDSRATATLPARVTVAVDSTGESVHQTGPKIWGGKIRTLNIPVRVA